MGRKVREEAKRLQRRHSAEGLLQDYLLPGDTYGSLTVTRQSSFLMK